MRQRRIADKLNYLQPSRQAVEVEEAGGPEPYLATVTGAGMTPMRERTVQTGRVRQSGGSAACFVW
jgi:uncharacterized protein (DUF1800 family)